MIDRIGWKRQKKSERSGGKKVVITVKVWCLQERPLGKDRSDLTMSPLRSTLHVHNIFFRQYFLLSIYIKTPTWFRLQFFVLFFFVLFRLPFRFFLKTWEEHCAFHSQFGVSQKSVFIWNMQRWSFQCCFCAVWQARSLPWCCTLGRVPSSPPASPVAW